MRTVVNVYGLSVFVANSSIRVNQPKGQGSRNSMTTCVFMDIMGEFPALNQL